MQFGSLRAADAEATQCRKQQPKGQEFRWLHATEQDRQHTAGHSSADGDAGAAGDAGDAGDVKISRFANQDLAVI
mgnify:CR=1 FL=1